MAVDWRKDIQKGTTYQEDRVGIRRHRAVRLWLGTPGAGEDIGAVVTAAIAEAGNVHPENMSELALVSVRARQEGDHFWVWLNYDPVTFVSDAPSPDVTVATIDITTMNIRSYATAESIFDGLPTPVTKTDDPAQGNKYRRPIVIAVPIWHIRVFFKFATSQAGSNSGMVGRVNDAGFSIGNRSFTQDTLRFDGVHQAVNVINDTGPVVVFTGYFQFTHRPDGWFNYALVDDAISNELMYPETTFITPILS